MKTDSVQYLPVMQYIPKAVKANATDIAIVSASSGRSHTKNTSDQNTHKQSSKNPFQVIEITWENWKIHLYTGPQELGVL